MGVIKKGDMVIHNGKRLFDQLQVVKEVTGVYNLNNLKFLTFDHGVNLYDAAHFRVDFEETERREEALTRCRYIQLHEVGENPHVSRKSNQPKHCFVSILEAAEHAWQMAMSDLEGKFVYYECPECGQPHIGRDTNG